MSIDSRHEPVLKDYLNNRPLPFDFLCSDVLLIQVAGPVNTPAFFIRGTFVQRDPLYGRERTVNLPLLSGPACEVRKVHDAEFLPLLRSKAIQALIVEAGTVGAVGPSEERIAAYVVDALRCQQDWQDLSAYVTTATPFQFAGDPPEWRITVSVRGGGAYTSYVTYGTPLSDVIDNIQRYMTPRPTPSVV